MSEESQGKRESYLAHEAVIRETTESTKMRIVFDASAKASHGSPSCPITERLFRDWAADAKRLECAGPTLSQTICGMW